jgi:hypothetical protein
MQNSSHKNPHSPRNPGTKLLHHKYPKNLISSHPSALLVILLFPVVVVLLLLLELLKNNILTHSLTYQSENKTFPQRRPQYTNSVTLKKTKLRFTLVTTQLIPLRLPQFVPQPTSRNVTVTAIHPSRSVLQSRNSNDPVEKFPAIVKLKTLIKASRNKHR